MSTANNKMGVSIQTKNRRYWLVKTGKASYFTPYRTVKDAAKALVI